MPNENSKPNEPKQLGLPEISASDAARALGKRGASKGGRARAEKLDSKTKSQIAKTAAEARWSLPAAFVEGPLKIGDVVFEAAVLEDRKTRVLSEKSFMDTMGMYYSGWISTNREPAGGEAVLPLHLSFEKLKPYIEKHLRPSDLVPLRYRTLSGNVAHGIPAELVPKICNVWVDALNGGGLGKRQLKIAEKAGVLLRGLENVAIVALVDEATGFQRLREGDALAKILEAFIAKELAEWVKTFEDDYYDEIYRLKGWKKPRTTARTQLIGKITNDIVYDRLAPGVKQRLQEIVGRDGKGRLKQHLHRSLTRDVGYQALKTHLEVITVLMKITPAGQWETFRRNLNAVRPKFDPLPQLPFTDS